MTGHSEGLDWLCTATNTEELKALRDEEVGIAAGALEVATEMKKGIVSAVEENNVTEVKDSGYWEVSVVDSPVFEQVESD
jgi:hypothetical protein